jgi:hypothetical protein
VDGRGQGRGTGQDVGAALSMPLARPDGSVTTLEALASSSSVLVVVVERDCPTSRGALRALADAGGRIAVVSQGRAESAHTLVAETGITSERTTGSEQQHDVLIELAPYPVSAALEAGTVPTFVVLEGGNVQDRQEGWDQARVAAMVARVGGELRSCGGLPEIKPGCQSRHTLEPDVQKRLEDEDATLGGLGGSIEDLWELGWNDGLPVVPPTPERVNAMLGDRDPGTSLGTIGPAQGEVTLERLAACAVLAGCDPSYFPVVEAASRAVMDPAFNAHGIINTTHFASPWIIINGPVRKRLRMNSGSNVLGPGNRANATIGRAVRLLMQLTGGGTPGGLDQSTLGGQHKFTACLPEREEVSPWEPWHVTLGYDANASTVTVMVGEGAAGVSDHTSESAADLATTLALGMGNAQVPAGSRAFYPVNSETLLIVCPEHATMLGQSGWTKQDLREHVVAHGGGKHLSEEEIVVVVAGGDAGRFSAVVAPWAGWGLGSKPVTRIIEEG